MNQKTPSTVLPDEKVPEGSTSTEAMSESHGKEMSDQKERYLRLAADFDNFRKRTAQEAERRSTAKKDGLMHELLPVVDNLERALAVGPNSSFEQLLQGVGMTLQQLRNLLKQNELEPEESVGKPFDPSRHEAIGSRRDASKADNSVLEIAQRGYYRGKEAFRPAKVIVNDLSQ